MGSLSPPDNFYLYLWRSPNSPGTLYLAKGFETAEALCRGLTEDGYIVKVIHMTSDTEFELCDGKLRPMAPGSQQTKELRRAVWPRPIWRPGHEPGLRIKASAPSRSRLFSRLLKKAVRDRLPYGRGSVNTCRHAAAILSRARKQADFRLFQHPVRTKTWRLKREVPPAHSRRTMKPAPASR